MESRKVEDLLCEYERSERLYKKFAEKIEEILSALLGQTDLKLHSIVSRHKGKKSLREKLKRPDKNYSAITDITDLAGVRVTTYFAEDVDVVAKVIDDEFKIDKENSVDKRAQLHPDQFGYASFHYVAELNQARSALPENQEFSNLKVEIQICSTLQHAWAEIQHDDYKLSETLPRDISRQFARLAGLLELADSEFCSIRRKLHDYAEKVPKDIELEPSNVLIDQVSLKSFLSTSTNVKWLDTKIATLMNMPLGNDNGYNVKRAILRLNWFGIRTIGELDAFLHSLIEVIPKFVKHWMEPEYVSERESLSISNAADGEIAPGVCIFFFAFIRAAKLDGEHEVRNYLHMQNIWPSHARQSPMAKSIIKCYELARNLKR